MDIKELKVGMYIRDININNIGIDKIIEIDRFIKLDKSGYFTYEYFYESIIRVSAKLIDLIEVGDYVNGNKVIEVVKYSDISTYLYIGEDFFEVTSTNNRIKSVVTKEQFEKIEYVIGGNNNEI